MAEPLTLTEGPTVTAYVLHGNPYILQEYRDGEAGLRPSFLKLLDLIDMDDPTWPATAAVLREMAEAGVEINEAAVSIAAKLGAHRLAGLDEVKVHGREAPYDGWTAGGPFKSIVYYIRRGPVVKIGTTAGAISRFTDLMPDEILAFEPGGNKEETFRHHQFAHLRCHGEHFRPEPELMEHIHRVREQYGDPPVDWPTVAILAKDTNIRMALAPLKSEEMITAEEAHDRLGIPVALLQRWLQRRKLSPASYTQHGEELFYAEHVTALRDDPREATRW